MSTPNRPASTLADRRPPLPPEPSVNGAVLDHGVLYRELSHGVYEVRCNPRDGAVYVASALAISGVKGGVIYRLDPETLEPVGAIHTDRGNFGLMLNAAGDRLYSTNPRDQSLTGFNLDDDTVIGRLDFQDVGADGQRFGPREVIYDAERDLLYVGGIGDPAVIWAVDARTLQLSHTIRNVGKWVTGLMLHPRTGDLYALNGDSEVLIIDPASGEVRQRFRPAGDAQALWLNLALDVERNRLYITDHSRLKTVLILDPDTGRNLGELPEAGESMGILLHPERRELYISHRERGVISTWDADTHALKRTVRAGPYPNSLCLGADCRTLYATVKTPFTADYAASKVESVLRIPLD